MVAVPRNAGDDGVDSACRERNALDPLEALGKAAEPAISPQSEDHIALVGVVIVPRAPTLAVVRMIATVALKALCGDVALAVM